MLLFVNVFITNKRMQPHSYKDLDPEIRAHSKLDVFKYSLASYSVIKWQKAIFYIELDDEFKCYESELRAYIDRLFPNNNYSNYRIDTYEAWIENIKLPDFDDETWIWFTCNDDHIFIDSSLDYLDHIVDEAAKLSKDNNKNVSIMISHWQEYTAHKKRGIILSKLKFHRNYNLHMKIVSDNPQYFVTDQSETASIQLTTKKVIRQWFSSAQAKMIDDLRRTDPLPPIKNTLLVVPYRELARHFDVYSHSSVSHDVVPPMFIPEGFFESKIKIQYGGGDRQPGYVYIHPEKAMMPLDMHHSQRKTNDYCDSNILYEDIPLFWRDKISEVKRVSFDQQLLNRAYVKQKLSELCSDHRFGYTPSQALKQFPHVLTYHAPMGYDEMRLIAKNHWNYREKLNYYIFNIKYFFDTRYLKYSFYSSLIKKKYPSFHEFIRLLKGRVMQLK